MIALLASPPLLLSQTLRGVVTDEQHTPLAKVTVAIPQLRSGTVTDDSGKFILQNIPYGRYVVEFSLVGFAKDIVHVDLSAGDEAITVTMQASPLEFPGVTVTAKPAADDIANTAQSVSVINGNQLDRSRDENILGSIGDFPGVALATVGPLSVKPVIRGLSFQRVVVLENGIRHAYQQWDDDDSPGIEGLDVASVEVVRGPGSVLFGSDALGGVVNVIHRQPEMTSGRGALSGILALNGYSSNRYGTGNFSLSGSGQNVAYRGDFGLGHAGDMRTPDGVLRNTGADEFSGGASIDINEEWGIVKAGFSDFDQQRNILSVDDSHATPYQKTVHTMGTLAYTSPASMPYQFEVNGTWQANTAEEFDDASAIDPAVHLRLSTTSLDAKLHHPSFSGIAGTFGLSFMHQQNETLGDEPLIPAFRQFNAAGFLFEEARVASLNISAGLRYDVRRLDVDANEELVITNQTRNYSAITWTGGVVWHLSDPVSIAADIGRGWRSPLAQELFVNGVEEGSLRYKIGQPDLVPEESINSELSLRYASALVKASVTYFVNHMQQYMYLRPTGTVDSTSGFFKYVYTQGNATIAGLEGSLDAAATDWAILTITVDAMEGKNDETDGWLPLMPAPRISVGVRFQELSLGIIENPYIAIASTSRFDQKNVDAEETPTPGYTLLSIGCGGKYSFSGNSLSVDCLVENVLDRSYRDHLSLYKNYALNSGRNISLKVSIPFTLVQ